MTDFPAEFPLAIAIERTALVGRGRAIFLQSGAHVSPNTVNIMATHGRGVVSAALRAATAYSLGIQPLPGARARPGAPVFLCSIEATECNETGISAFERALTLNVIGADSCTKDDIIMPGHIMPSIVPEMLAEGCSLSEVAFKYVAKRGRLGALAWCDILDEEGDTADTATALALAEALQLPVYFRSGNDLAPAGAFDSRGVDANLVPSKSGLVRGQFA